MMVRLALEILECSYITTILKRIEVKFCLYRLVDVFSPILNLIVNE